MFNKIRNHRRGVAAVAILGMLVSGAFAYTASNTVPANKAGEGTHAIAGFTITADTIHYALNATDPRTIDTITFDTTTVPTNSAYTAFVRVISSGGTWYACTYSTLTWTCSTTSDHPLVNATDTFDFTVAD